MRVISKKQEEYGYLYSARRLCCDFAEGEIIFSETPDFILRSSETRRLGIEVTQIFTHDGKEKNGPMPIAAARDRIMCLAQSFAEKMRIPPVAVTLYFNWTLEPFRKPEAAIAKALAETVRDWLPSPGESADLRCRVGSVQPLEVDQILVHRVNQATEHKWQWCDTVAINYNIIPYIEQTIHKKSCRMPALLKNCDECWLLIVSPFVRAVSSLRTDDTIMLHTYTSPFARTYFLDLGNQRCIQLQTVAPATWEPK